MPRQLLAEWSQSLRRLAKEKVTHADKSTVANALRTWQALEEHLALRNRELPPEAVGHRHVSQRWGTNAPAVL